MLACVCQPADPSIFRRSPIPLGAPPLKITNRGDIPKPGKTIRITPSTITDAPSVKNKIEFTNRLTDFDDDNTESKTATKTNEDLTLVNLTMTTTPDKTKLTKKLKNNVKKTDSNLKSCKSDRTKGISENSLAFNVDSKNCDRKLERKSNNFEKVLFWMSMFSVLNYMCYLVLHI